MRLTLLVCLLTPHPAVASEALTSLIETHRDKLDMFIVSLAVVNANKAGADLDPEKRGLELGLFEIINTKELNFAFSLNPNAKTEDLSLMLERRPLMVIDRSTDEINYLTPRPRKKTKVELGASATIETLREALQDALGYSGIVIARKEQQVLVRMLFPEKPRGVQAIVISRATRKRFIGDEDGQVVAFMELEESMDHWALFSIQRQSGRIPVGSKVQIEK